MPSRARFPVRVTLAHAADGGGRPPALRARRRDRRRPARRSSAPSRARFARELRSRPVRGDRVRPARLPVDVHAGRGPGPTTGCGRGSCSSSSRQQPGVAIDVRPDHPLPGADDRAAGRRRRRAARPLRVVGLGARARRRGRGAGIGRRRTLAAAARTSTSRGSSAPAGSSRARDYVACLVPAFEAGRLAGLGPDVPDAATTTGPAWGGAGGVGATITLPLYFHWEFRTGPAGDFESLARQLEPRPVPDTVGGGRCSSARPTRRCRRWRPTPAASSSSRARCGLPTPAPAPPLGPRARRPYVAALVEVLDAPARARRSTAPRPTPRRSRRRSTAGTARQGRTTLDRRGRAWLSELNTDPRHRAAAGLGTEVVRSTRSATCRRPGSRSATCSRPTRCSTGPGSLRRVGERIHARHVAPLGRRRAVRARRARPRPHPARRSDRRAPAAGEPSARGRADAAFRRLAAPRSRSYVARRVSPARPLRRQSTVHGVGALAHGELKLDLLAGPRTGSSRSDLLVGLPAGGAGDVSGARPGTAGGAAPAAMVGRLAGANGEARPGRPPEVLVLRPNVALSGAS